MTTKSFHVFQDLKMVILALVCFTFTACGPSYSTKDAYGADEFVLDSYKIRNGKMSILQLEGSLSYPLEPNYLEDIPDTLQEGDVLQVALFHPKRADLCQAIQTISQTLGFQVVEREILLPDLPAVDVQGMTLREAQNKIQEVFNQHIQDVRVFLAYKDRPERKVELNGLVQSSSVIVDGRMRLFEVLSKAKISAEANLFKSYVIRDQKPLSVDLNRLMKEGDMSQNIVMQGGDKIYIAEPTASSLMVLGEVGKPGLVALPSGTLPLRDALAKAGGILFTGNKSFIQVIRGNIIRPKIYTLDWQHVVHLPTQSLLLMPGDIVYVAATPITEWNRFVSQLFPSFTAIDLFSKGTANIVAIP